MRRFLITMYQKGNLNMRVGGLYNKYITYEKTTNKSTQIVCIDYEGIEKEYIKEKNEYAGAGLLHNPINTIENILGIHKDSPYRLRNELREIKEDDKEGYCSLDFKYITKETEKAYYSNELEMWIPKSQTIKEDNILYIKRWIMVNNV